MKINEIVELVTAVQQGDEQAFNRLYKEYEKLVLFVAHQYVHNASDAQDIAQETFIEVRKSIVNLKEPKYFKAWLNRVTFSKISRFFEKNKDIVVDMSNYNQLTNLEETRTYMIPDKTMRKHSDHVLLGKCMEDLKPIYRQVLFLRFFEQLSIQEIAYALNIPEGTVKSRLSVAKNDLKSKILATEKREGERLTFKVGTLEATITAFFMDSFSEFAQVGTAVSSLSLLAKVKRGFLIHPVIGIVACSLMVMCVGGSAYLYHEMQIRKTTDEVVHDTKKEDNEIFPFMEFEQQKITTPKQAYSILYNYAHCEEEWNLLSISQKSSLKSIYQAMNDFGGEYKKMADRLGIKEF